MESQIKRFTVYRRGDISATHTSNQVNPSGMPQYEGVVFSDGKCVLRWLTNVRSVSVWNSFADAMEIHGHFGPPYDTDIIWHDHIEPDMDSMFGVAGASHIYQDSWGFWYGDEAYTLTGPYSTIDIALEELAVYVRSLDRPKTES